MTRARRLTARRLFSDSRHGPGRMVPYRPRLEGLEERAAPAVFKVTTTNDGGPGSLRQAVLDANATKEEDLILLAAETYPLTIPRSCGSASGLAARRAVAAVVV